MPDTSKKAVPKPKKKPSRAQYMKARREAEKTKEESQASNQMERLVIAAESFVKLLAALLEKIPQSAAFLTELKPLPAVGGRPAASAAGTTPLPVPIVVVATSSSDPMSPDFVDAWAVELPEPIFSIAARRDEKLAGAEMATIQEALEEAPNSLLELNRFNAYADDQSNDFKKTAQLHRAQLRRLGIAIPAEKAVPVVNVP